MYQEQCMNDKITFSFGENWRSFVDTVTEEAIESARKDIEDWLGKDGVGGRPSWMQDAARGYTRSVSCFLELPGLFRLTWTARA